VEAAESAIGVCVRRVSVMKPYLLFRNARNACSVKISLSYQWLYGDYGEKPVASRQRAWLSLAPRKAAGGVMWRRAERLPAGVAISGGKRRRLLAN